MKTFELNVIEDEKVMKTVALWNIVMTILSIVPFYALERRFSSGDPFYMQLNFQYIIISTAVVIIGGILIIMFHELIHGIFFKLFNPQGSVTYGYKAGMFYASSPGEVYHRKHFSVIIIMPFIIITTLLLTALYFFDYTAITILLVFHTGACAGDFYFLYVMYQNRDLKYIEDTETGLVMYQKKPDIHI